MTVTSPRLESPGSAPLTGQESRSRPTALTAWLIVGLLFLATLVNYLDRQTISVLATRIAEDPAMQLTDANFSNGPRRYNGC